MQIMLQNGLFNKDDIGKIDHLLGRHRGNSMLRKLGKILNGVKHTSVNRLQYIIMNVV